MQFDAGDFDVTQDVRFKYVLIQATPRPGEEPVLFVRAANPSLRASGDAAELPPA